ncbi:unnamed protein product, partial [Mesorhabditis spiculigera]
MRFFTLFFPALVAVALAGRPESSGVRPEDADRCDLSMQDCPPNFNGRIRFGLLRRKIEQLSTGLPKVLPEHEEE